MKVVYPLCQQAGIIREYFSFMKGDQSKWPH
jgi:hypothetical protein